MNHFEVKPGLELVLVRKLGRDQVVWNGRTFNLLEVESLEVRVVVGRSQLGGNFVAAALKNQCN